jgi:hypothetical protein
LAVRDLPGCCGEHRQRFRHCPLLPGRQLAQDAGDQRPPPHAGLVYHLPPGSGY